MLADRSNLLELYPFRPAGTRAQRALDQTLAYVLSVRILEHDDTFRGALRRILRKGPREVIGGAMVPQEIGRVIEGEEEALRRRAALWAKPFPDVYVVAKTLGLAHGRR